MNKILVCNVKETGVKEIDAGNTIRFTKEGSERHTYIDIELTEDGIQIRGDRGIIVRPRYSNSIEVILELGK